MCCSRINARFTLRVAGCFQVFFIAPRLRWQTLVCQNGQHRNDCDKPSPIDERVAEKYHGDKYDNNVEDK